MIRKVVDQGTGGVRCPDVQLASTSQREDEVQEKAGGKERWNGEGGGKKQGKNVDTCSNYKSRDEERTIRDVGLGGHLTGALKMSL